MKKITLTVMFIVTLLTFAFGDDGGQDSGTKTCQPSTSNPCRSVHINQPDQEADFSVINLIKDFLANIL